MLMRKAQFFFYADNLTGWGNVGDSHFASRSIQFCGALLIPSPLEQPKLASSAKWDKGRRKMVLVTVRQIVTPFSKNRRGSWLRVI